MPNNVPITVSFNVSPLPDNAIWFENAAAWTSYWAGQNFSANIPQASTSSFGVVMTASTVSFTPVGLAAPNQVTFSLPNPDGSVSNYSLPSAASFDALYNAYLALVADYTATKTALKTAGLISA